MKIKGTNGYNAKNVYLWNTLGGLSNAGLSVIAVMIINRITTTSDAGLFTLGFANAMLLQHVGSFDSRSHQCADAAERFHFSDYFTFRIFTCLLMAFATALFVLLNHYSGDRASITLLLALFCILSNVSDIFQGSAQKNERLDISGQSMLIRTILGLLFLTLILKLTHNLYLAVNGLIIAQIIVILLFDIPKTLRFGFPKLNFNFKHLKTLFAETFPLFLSLFLQAYIYNMPKYAIDLYLPMEMQAVYGILFMPASIVTLCGSFIFRPVLTRLSFLWEANQYKLVVKMCLRRIAVLIGITFLVALAGYLFGTPVLSLFYAVDVNKYKVALVIVLFGGGFTGVSTLLYFMATAVHEQYKMFICYFLSFIVSILIAFPLVKSFGIDGASWSYLITCIFLNILIMILMSRAIYKAMKLQTKKPEGE